MSNTAIIPLDDDGVEYVHITQNGRRDPQRRLMWLPRLVIETHCYWARSFESDEQYVYVVGKDVVGVVTYFEDRHHYECKDRFGQFISWIPKTIGTVDGLAHARLLVRSHYEKETSST